MSPGPIHQLDLDRGTETFARVYTGARPTLFVRVPGRVNLIGEHTDYNNGLVLPMAIDAAMGFSAAPHDNDTLAVYSERFDDHMTLPLRAGNLLSDNSHTTPADWTRHIRAAADVATELGVRLRPARIVISSSLADGAGLSSSAALHVGLLLTLATLSEEPVDPHRLIQAARESEQRAVGTPCGIMDQTAVMLCRRGHALLLDCRDGAHSHIPFDDESVTWRIIDSGVRHDLSDGRYAERVDQCTMAVNRLRQAGLACASLRDITVSQLPQLGSLLDTALYRRVRHVVTEIDRVTAMTGALDCRDWQQVGRLLNAGHESLQADYAVSCPELDAIVEIANSVPGVLGARMTGGGFGGSVLALCRTDAATNLHTAIETQYPLVSGRAATVRPVAAGGGASIEIIA